MHGPGPLASNGLPATRLMSSVHLVWGRPTLRLPVRGRHSSTLRPTSIGSPSYVPRPLPLQLRNSLSYVANRPDIVDRSVRRAIIVDITIPHDDNLVKAEKEKVSKYLDLAHEITAMWNVESTVIVPIVVPVNGLLAKSFDQLLKKLSLGCWIKGRIQKAVVLETARILRSRENM
ncbi:jg23672 [Pararge aegeria aegeria]|uniref:Jg23672 protein n=1 Tax=Pararge aegeria aegeria TaxID=348720 RepID=A0A8S4RF74_9NEOP|nr:jg23672 [Pararge aegeria aegeria]